MSTPRPLSLALETATCGPTNSALVIIDMQTDFLRRLGAGGYVDKMGYDLSLTRAPDRADQEAAGRRARKAGWTVIHTREGHRPDLSDLPPNKRLALAADRRRHRRSGSLRSHPGARARRAWEIIPDLAPVAGEPIIDKPGKGSFCATDPRVDVAHPPASTNLVLTGITTDVCVHTTMREANDRGFEWPDPRGLHRCDGQGKPRRRAQDGRDAGRRVRRCRQLGPR